ncbi:MAG TPA: DUF1801 domain-containing protein [Pyrinomonadaceae bacterium]|nr:DUF1801 domain-containing protein [Pyrinomonadaceae bacterium]
MAELKTKPTKQSVNAFLSKVSNESRRKDCKTVLDLMADVTQAKPEMWGDSIVGFGRYRYKYASGREGEWMVTGFSPRKTDLTLYLMGGFDSEPELMTHLGKYKTGKSCLYIRKLADVDLKTLRKLVKSSVEKMADQRIDS